MFMCGKVKEEFRVLSHILKIFLVVKVVSPMKMDPQGQFKQELFLESPQTQLIIRRVCNSNNSLK